MWIENEFKVKVNIIRHGKTSFNERHCYIGITDADLSENGILEIKEKALKAIYPSCEAIFVSPMKRAIQTTEIIFPNKEYKVIQQLKEMDFGSFEGKNYDELKDNLFYRKWIDESRGVEGKEMMEKYENLGNPLDYGVILPESMDKYYDRVLSGFSSILKESKLLSEISIVAHGGTIMAIASALTKEDYYSFMLGCGDGVKAEAAFSEEDGIIKISRFSITDRIHI